MVSPLVVAAVGSASIMFAALYMSHGFSITTTTAVLGTLAITLLARHSAREAQEQVSQAEAEKIMLASTTGELAFGYLNEKSEVRPGPGTTTTTKKSSGRPPDKKHKK